MNALSCKCCAVFRIHLGAGVAACLALALDIGVARATEVSAGTDAGRGIAAGCASCHGIDGSANGVSPPLAGQRSSDLEAKLKAFKSGAREGTVMPQLARGYSDVQLEEVAMWFATRAHQRGTD